MNSNQDPSPSSAPEGEAELVTVAIAEEEIHGLDKPKIVEWEDLQQELARFCSLSGAIREAKEKKGALARRVDEFIEVRGASLYQSNQLEEMKQKLDAQNLALSDLSRRATRESEDVKKKKEQLCIKTRSLLVASKTLSASYQQLQEANKSLARKWGHGHHKNLQKKLRKRQQYMITQVNLLYPVKALNDQISDEKPDLQSHSNKSRDPVMSSRQKSSLSILGQQLTVLPTKMLGIFVDKKEMQRSATVLGYVAHAVLLASLYLDVPLRYPLRFGGSRSYILDRAPPEVAPSEMLSSSVMGINVKPTEFPLFLEGQDTTRAAYAVFLLNKDLEQLLNYIGAESLGPRHVLANLKELYRIIESNAFID